MRQQRTVLAENEQCEVAARKVVGWQAKQLVVSTQQKPVEVLDVYKTPLVHELHDRRNVLLVDPDEHKASRAGAVQLQGRQLGDDVGIGIAGIWVGGGFPSSVDQHSQVVPLQRRGLCMMQVIPYTHTHR